MTVHSVEHIADLLSCVLETCHCHSKEIIFGMLQTNDRLEMAAPIGHGYIDGDIVAIPKGSFDRIQHLLLNHLKKELLPIECFPVEIGLQEVVFHQIQCFLIPLVTEGPTPMMHCIHHYGKVWWKGDAPSGDNQVLNHFWIHSGAC